MDSFTAQEFFPTKIPTAICFWLFDRIAPDLSATPSYMAFCAIDHEVCHARMARLNDLNVFLENKVATLDAQFKQISV